MSMTVKQLADHLHVSKTAIRKRFTEEFKSKYVETSSDGSLRVTEEGCKLIEESLQKRAETSQTKFAETNVILDLHLLIDSQKEILTFLRGQLVIKDDQIQTQQKQIEDLRVELERERQHSREQSDKLAILADQAQQLHAAVTIKQIPDNQTSKKHWWQRKRKGNENQ